MFSDLIIREKKRNYSYYFHVYQEKKIADLIITWDNIPNYLQKKGIKIFY